MSELAILGGSKTRTEPYPQWPVWDQRDIDAVVEVVKSGRWVGSPILDQRQQNLRKNSQSYKAVSMRYRWSTGQ